MVKKKQDLFIVKHAENIEEKDEIAREIAILKILEKKLPVNIPKIEECFPLSYLFFYKKILGEELNYTLYWDFYDKSQNKLAKDMANFIYQLHSQMPIEFARSIGFKETSWPLNAEILEKYVPKILDKPVFADGNMLKLFEKFIESYREILNKPYPLVFLHNDLHGKNILVNRDSLKLQGIIDFADAAIGDPFIEFRLLYEIDIKLMEEVIYWYCHEAGIKLDIKRAHVFYLATAYSRLVEIMQGKSKYEEREILVDIMIYEEKYNSKI